MQSHLIQCGDSIRSPVGLATMPPLAPRPTRSQLFITLAASVAMFAFQAGCQLLTPGVDSDWAVDQALMPRAVIDGDEVIIHNIRGSDYRSADDFTVKYFDKTYRLDQLETVDFVVVPFSDLPGGAHTFLSYGFADGGRVAISVEARRKRGEVYSALRSSLPVYPLMYVVGDEHDLVGLRANHRLDDVYVYRANAAPPQVRRLFVDMLERANQLDERPEFYNVVTNNCTTNIRRHINQVSPGRVPYSYQILLPAFSDKLAYDLGLIDRSMPFETLKARSRINELAWLYRDDPEFSAKLRR